MFLGMINKPSLNRSVWDESSLAARAESGG